jgi:solute carrier family 13 (sodium-dependent dicarboxylate transporter), member 2/3/5
VDGGLLEVQLGATRRRLDTQRQARGELASEVSPSPRWWVSRWRPGASGEHHGRVSDAELPLDDTVSEVGPSRSLVGRLGLLLGPVAALAVYLVVPDQAGPADSLVELGHAGRATAAIGVLMAIWWMTEALHVSATALLPVALFPLFGVLEVDAAAAPYANPLIFLFLGGFLLALSMQRWGLERRIALVALRLVGTEPRVVVGGFMVLTAVFSMWVSNTATVAMMLPIALSVIDAAVPSGRHALVGHPNAPGSRFSRSLLLGIAASASIGGVGTLIGTPPNLFLASFSRDELGIEIGFAEWLMVGIPLVAVFLPIAWVLLTFVLFRPDVDRSGLDRFLDDVRPSGRMQRAEWVVLVVFSLTAAAWVFRPLLEDITILGGQPFSGLSDAGIAVIAGVALFVAPSGDGSGGRVLDWETARQLPWGILVLFGGGLSLAAAIASTGVDDFLGLQVEGLDVHPVVLIMVVSAGVVFLTELTSNTATAAALVPIVAAVAPSLGLHPLALAIPVAVAASLAFMLPVATPPNAIVFGSGFVAMPDMMRMGLRLNVVSIAIITSWVPLLALPVLGIDLRTG